MFEWFFDHSVELIITGVVLLLVAFGYVGYLASEREKQEYILDCQQKFELSEVNCYYLLDKARGTKK